MRYFLDTEFIESGPKKPIQLISIGIVSEDGKQFYAISNEFNAADASRWVVENVLSHLTSDDQTPRQSLSEIVEGIKAFLGDRPEIWGYYADYDWVVFCQLFGAMIDLPKGYPMFCRDIKQLCDSKGNPKLPVQDKGEHNALADAHWNKQAWEFLNN